MKILVQDSIGVRPLEEGYATEAELQEFLREHADLMPLEEIDLNAPPLLCIGWEVGLASGSEDILYIDPSGLLTVVETKLRKNPEARREVVGQILEYAAQMSTWSASDVERQAEKFFASKDCPERFRDSTLEKAFHILLEANEDISASPYEYILQQIQANIELGHIRLIIAIDEPPEPLLKTVEFVNRFSERFEMYLVQLKRFHDLAKKQNIFVPALFGKVASTSRRSPRIPWDWQRYKTDLGWTDQDVSRAQELIARLESAVSSRGSELRFYRGWVAMNYQDRYAFGIQKFQKTGMELWFYLQRNPVRDMPNGVTSRQRSQYYLHFAGKLDALKDDQLRRLCLAAVKVIDEESAAE